MLVFIYLLSAFFFFTIGTKQQGPVNNKDPITYFWDVTGWSAGCARSGCYYDFKIRGPAYGNVIPAFEASCSGYKEGSPFALCQLQDEQPSPPTLQRKVAARLEATNQTGTGAHIVVSYEFSDSTQGDKSHNYTGYAVSRYNQFVAPPQNFTITPTETS